MQHSIHRRCYHLFASTLTNIPYDSHTSPVEASAKYSENCVKIFMCRSIFMVQTEQERIADLEAKLLILQKTENGGKDPVLLAILGRNVAFLNLPDSMIPCNNYKY